MVAIASAAMPPANDIIADNAIRHALQLERYKSHVVKEILTLLKDDVFNDVVEKLAKTNNINTIKAREDLIRSINKLVAAGYRSMGEKLEAELLDFAVTESEWQAATIRNAAPINVDVLTPPPALIKSIVTKSPIQGRFVSDWVEGLAKGTQEKIAQQLRIGIAEGESIPEMVRRIRGTKAAQYADGILQISRRNAEAVVRTSVAGVSTNCRDEMYKANSDVIKGVQYVATLDNRTTPICMGLDGRVFDIGKGPRPPQHWNCRSTTAPVLKSWKEMGIDAKEAPPSTRASMDGQVSERLTYGKWLKKQPIDIQNDALGITKARLFRSNKVKIDRFANQRGRTLTLAELRKREGLSVSDVSRQ